MDTQGLKDQLKQLLHTCEEMYIVLTSEEACAAQNDLGALENITQQKQALILQLNSLDKTLKNSLNISAENRVEFTQKLHAYNDNELNQLWNNYIISLQKCEKQNKKNGFIINTQIKNTNQTLDFLKQFMNSGSAELYSSNGKQNVSPADNTMSVKV